MSKAEPTVQKFMTTQPYTIEAEKSLAEAVRMMETHQIRHLPVTQSGKLTGILSDRDLKAALALSSTSAEGTRVGDVCHDHPYQTEPERPLSQVADEMAEKHYGSALVVQNGKLVGIFTTVDACRAISWVLKQRFHEH